MDYFVINENTRQRDRRVCQSKARGKSKGKMVTLDAKSRNSILEAPKKP